MIKISTKGRYSTRLMVDLVTHGKSSPISVSDSAKRMGVSVKYLERLVALLKKAKLVRGVRGLYGGLILNKPSGKISLKDIIEAVEGPLCLVNCVRDRGACKRSRKCLSRKCWFLLTRMLSNAMSSLSLEKMAKGVTIKDFPDFLNKAPHD